MKPTVKTIAALCLFVGTLGAGPVQDTGEGFSFVFHGTDVVPWAKGERRGKVTDVEGPVAKALQAFLARATTSADLALYGVDNQDWVFESLRDLVDRGVRTRAVVDQQDGALGDWLPANFTYPDTARLPEALPEQDIVPDQTGGEPRESSIMHNKFAAVDRRWLWLGSANVSHTCLGAEYNANTVLVVDSPDLTRLYADEFQQMHAQRRFSTRKAPRAARPALRYTDGTEVSVFFSPQDDTLERAVLPFIAATRSTLDIGMFYLTDDRVAAALAAAVSRGVKVRLIYDALAAAHPTSLHEQLRADGVAVRVESWGGKMHMKDAVADGRHVLMGSMNWSAAGSTANDENTLIVRNNPALAGKLASYFARLWATLATSEGQTDPRAESRASVNSCQDGLDNDHDGQLDAADSGCR